MLDSQRTLSMKSRILSLALGSLLIAGNTPAADSKKEARVTQIIREVNVLPANNAERAAVLNDRVAENTGVRTGSESRSELTFVDQTITRLGANTVFSFTKAGRNAEVDSGSILLRVPKESGGGRIRSSAVTVAVTGTTLILESARDGRSRLYVLEGSARISLVKYPKQIQNLHSAQMVDVPAGATSIPPPTNFDLNDLMKKHPLITDFPPLPSQGLIADAARQQPPPQQTSSGPPIFPILPVLGVSVGGLSGGGSHSSNPPRNQPPRPPQPTGTTGTGTSGTDNPTPGKGPHRPPTGPGKVGPNKAPPTSSTPSPVITRTAPGNTNTPSKTTGTTKSSSATKRAVKKPPQPNNGPR